MSEFKPGDRVVFKNSSTVWRIIGPSPYNPEIFWIEKKFFGKPEWTLASQIEHVKTPKQKALECVEGLSTSNISWATYMKLIQLIEAIEEKEQ